MEKQMHRLLSFMLSLILVVGLIPGTMMAYAVEYTELTSVALTGAPESYIVGETVGTLAVPKASAEYSVEVALNGYSLGEKVEDAYVFENSDTVELYDFNDDGTFFCIFEDDGTGCSDWSSVVTTFEANKDYWLVIALTKQNGDALPETDLDADNFKLINGCADKYTVFDDDLWWVEFKLNRLSDAAPSVYNITFDANGGSVAPVSATTGNDGKLTSLPTPTHTSPYMTFDGWYTGKTGDTKVTADTVFTSDTTIYARWNADYAIEVTLNGYEPGKNVADTTFSENSDTVDIDRENCHIFTEKDGEPDWDSEVTEFEANKDYWLVIALTKQGGDELTYADLTADDVNLTNDYTAELIDYDDGLWWVSYKLKPLENSVSTPTVIDEIHISGVTMPVVGAMPINFATTSTPSVTIGEDIFWVRYVPETNNLTDLYDDNTNVDNTPFRSGIKYFLQVILEPQNGYTIAADAKIFYNGIQLPMPDASLSQSCATVHPEGTMAMALIGGETSVPTYTVTFDYDGGSAVAAQNVESGKTASKPTDPIKEGYTFRGWYLGETEYNFETPVSGDITLKAKWEAVVEEPKHTCDIKPVAKDEPSCTEGGKEAYYKCEDCGKFYEDALGAKEITDINAWGNLPKLDHTESDWMSDKDNHWKECTVTACGVILENSKAAHKDNNKDGKCDVCEYNVGISGGSSEDDKPSDNPQTGDNNMMWLWIALLFVGSAGITATTVAEKKKLSVK